MNINLYTKSMTLVSVFVSFVECVPPTVSPQYLFSSGSTVSV